MLLSRYHIKTMFVKTLSILVVLIAIGWIGHCDALSKKVDTGGGKHGYAQVSQPRCTCSCEVPQCFASPTFSPTGSPPTLTVAQQPLQRFFPLRLPPISLLCLHLQPKRQWHQRQRQLSSLESANPNPFLLC